jgi:hypothetical protein
VIDILEFKTFLAVRVIRRVKIPAQDSSLTHKECSTTSLGMPLMPEGFHANISFFTRRKPTSALSYLGDLGPDEYRSSVDTLGIQRYFLRVVR